MDIVTLAAHSVLKDIQLGLKEISEECNWRKIFPIEAMSDFNPRNYIHIPYFPAFHQPGWMTRMLIGPYDAEWKEWVIGDIQAGITVLMTLVPQVSFDYSHSKLF